MTFRSLGFQLKAEVVVKYSEETGPLFNLTASSTWDLQVERLKEGLVESEQARTKLLDKAKRHVRTHAVYGVV